MSPVEAHRRLSAVILTATKRMVIGKRVEHRIWRSRVWKRHGDLSSLQPRIELVHGLETEGYLMIIAYHAIFTTYGTWLPNDPRGSFSVKVYKQAIRELGEVHYGRRAVQPSADSMQQFWAQARPKLARPPYFINDRTRPLVARGFTETVNRLHLEVGACAIMNDHVHILLRRTAHKVEYVVGRLKGAATRLLHLTQTPWTRGLWKVFIRDEQTMAMAAEYINSNPPRAGLEQQRWDFVSPVKACSGSFRRHPDGG